MGIYGDIAWQSFISRLLPWKQEVLLHAHHFLGKDNAVTLAAIGSLAALAAYALLYAMGYGLRDMLHLTSTETQRARSLKAQTKARIVLPLLMVFLAPGYIGVFLLLAAGFYRTDTRLALAAVIAAELLLRIRLFML